MLWVVGICLVLFICNDLFIFLYLVIKFVFYIYNLKLFVLYLKVFRLGDRFFFVKLNM